MIGSQVAFCFWLLLNVFLRIIKDLHDSLPCPVSEGSSLAAEPRFLLNLSNFRLHSYSHRHCNWNHPHQQTITTIINIINVVTDIIILIIAYDSVTAHQSNMFLKAGLTKCYPLQLQALMMWLSLIKGPCFNGLSCLWAFPTSPSSFPHFQNKSPQKNNFERLAKKFFSRSSYHTNQKTTRQHFKAPVWAKCNFPSSQFGLGKTGCTWVWCGSTSKLNCFPGNRKVRGRQMD